MDKSSGNKPRFWRGFRVVVVAVVLLLSVFAGVLDAPGEIHSASTAGQWAATATQLFYSACAVLALIAMWVRRAWVFPLLLAWASALTATGAIAAVAWGGAGLLAGAAAGLSIATIAGLIVWAWHSAH